MRRPPARGAPGRSIRVSADVSDSRPDRRRTHGPGPFDPGAEFGYDPERARGAPEEDDFEINLVLPDVGPGPFDPGPDVGYDRSRSRDPGAEVELEHAAAPEE